MYLIINQVILYVFSFDLIVMFSYCIMFILYSIYCSMDIQYIGDASYLLVRYVTGYVGKHDKGPTQPIWRTLGEVRHEEMKSKLYTYAGQCMRNREIGLPEACDHLLHHAPCKFSHGDEPVYLNARPFSSRFRFIPGKAVEIFFIVFSRSNVVLKLV